MLDIIEAFASALILPSVAFGILIGALIGSCISWFVFGAMDYKVIVGSAAITSFLNFLLFSYLDRDDRRDKK